VGEDVEAVGENTEDKETVCAPLREGEERETRGREEREKRGRGEGEEREKRGRGEGEEKTTLGMISEDGEYWRVVVCDRRSPARCTASLSSSSFSLVFRTLDSSRP
jgi:hypothetical protein